MEKLIQNLVLSLKDKQISSNLKEDKYLEVARVMATVLNDQFFFERPDGCISLCSNGGNFLKWSDEHR